MKLRMKIVAVAVGVLSTVGVSQAFAGPLGKTNPPVDTERNGCVILDIIDYAICIPRLSARVGSPEASSPTKRSTTSVRLPPFSTTRRCLR